VPETVPDFLTVEEAARILRIGRTAAYALARSYRETGEGLPVIELGRLLRVPRARLEQLHGGPLAPRDDDATEPPTDTPDATVPETRDRRPRRRARRAPTNQAALPFEA